MLPCCVIRSLNCVGHHNIKKIVREHDLFFDIRMRRGHPGA